MRLIDADALMTELSTMYKELTSTEDFMGIGYDKAIADVVVTAHRQPTVDAAPSKYGKWIPCDVCKYNPPSAKDGKPCTMCPAVGEDNG